MKTNRFIPIITAAAILFSSVACATPVYAAETVQNEAVASGQAVGLEGLVDTFRPTDKNYMYSPFSLNIALALLANGADEATKAEILKVIGSGSLEEFNSHALELTKRYGGDGKVVLKSANGLWINSDNAPETEFSQAYLETVKKYFDAESGTVTNENAVKIINDWCAKSTDEKIKKLADDPNFAAMLANALYFKGNWKSPFLESSTHKELFFDRDGRKAEIDFMSKTEDYNYYGDDDIKILELDYEGGEAAMYFVLDNGKRVDIVPYLDKMQPTYTSVKIPKFKIESDGVYDFDAEFAESADFSKMFENGGVLCLSRILQKTFINVDEYGTEAAAAYGVEFTSSPPNPNRFWANEPFEFYIIDKSSKETLFAGEYAYAPEESYLKEQKAEVPTETTTENIMWYSPNPAWYAPATAVWTPFSWQYINDGDCRYTVRLYDADNVLLAERTAAAREYDYYNNSGEIRNWMNVGCYTDFEDETAKHGEGFYYFVVEYDYGKKYDNYKRTEQSPMVLYTPEQPEKTSYMAEAAFAKKLSDVIAVSGKNTIPGLHECIYSLSDDEAAELVSEQTVDGKDNIDTMFVEGVSNYRQFVFKPKKQGLVTLRVIHRTIYEKKEFGYNECTYIIDADLKAHVYEPSKGYLVGDADNDGRLTAADSANVLQKALISTFETPVEAVDKENYLVSEGNTVYDRAAVLDINKNGSVDADDAARILQMTLTGY